MGLQGTERTRGLHAVVLALFVLLRNSSADSRFFLLVGMEMVGNGMILLLEEKHLKCPCLTLWDFISQWKKEHLEDHQLKNLI